MPVVSPVAALASPRSPPHAPNAPAVDTKAIVPNRITADAVRERRMLESMAIGRVAAG